MSTETVKSNRFQICVGPEGDVFQVIQMTQNNVPIGVAHSGPTELAETLVRMTEEGPNDDERI